MSGGLFIGISLQAGNATAAIYIYTHCSLQLLIMTLVEEELIINAVDVICWAGHLFF